jgi:hypothetical protein
LVTLQVIYSGITLYFPLNYLETNWYITQITFATLCGLAFYVASKYDPRKPPHNIDVQKHRRHFGILSHFFLIALLDWAFRINFQKIGDYAYIELSFAVNIALVARFWAVTIFMLSKEISNPSLFCFKSSFWFQIAFFIIALVVFQLHRILPDTVYEHIFLLLMKESSYLCSLSIAYVIAGGHREQVRAVPPPQVLVQFPLAAAVAVNV